MAHWSDAYLGRPYVPGTADCAQLAVDVAREVFGRTVTLPQHCLTPRAWTAQIDALQADYADPIAAPEEGQPVLMKARGWLSHVGVYTEIEGVGHVLHAMKNAGQVVRHRLRDLPRINLTVEGFYRWK